MKAIAIILQILAVFLFFRLFGKRIAQISWRKRALWFIGAAVLFLAPCMADDILGRKDLYMPAMILAAVYLGVSVSFLYKR
ncbi:MAG TPA: hypothetical protein VD994_03540 [Prosthecobacter sp.]|nr:hypothetical protein [Prosthecobacter sp.]